MKNLLPNEDCVDGKVGTNKIAPSKKPKTTGRKRVRTTIDRAGGKTKSSKKMASSKGTSTFMKK